MKFSARLSAVVFALAIYTGCSSHTDQAQLNPQISQIQYDGPGFELIIDPVKFVADIPFELVSKLCEESNGSNSAAFKCYANLDRHCINYLVNGPGSETSRLLVVGEKNYPSFGSNELTQQLVSALSKYPELDLVESHARNTAKIYTALRKSRGRYRLKAFLTEVYPSAEEDVTGFNGLAGGPLSITLLAKTEITDRRGYARVDLAVIDVKSGRIVQTFAVMGTASGELIKHGLLGTRLDKKNTELSIIHIAVQAAFEKAAEHISKKLRETGNTV